RRVPPAIAAARTSRAAAPPARAPASRFLFQQLADQRHHPRPLLRFGREMLLAGTGDCVKLRAAIVVADAPTALDQPLLLETQQRRIDGALVERQDAARHLFDAPRHA